MEEAMTSKNKPKFYEPETTRFKLLASSFYFSWKAGNLSSSYKNTGLPKNCRHLYGFQMKNSLTPDSLGLI